MNYAILIKSGTDYPDFEDSVEARSKREAIKLMVKKNKWLMSYQPEQLRDWTNEVPSEMPIIKLRRELEVYK